MGMRLIDANRVIIEAHKERGHYLLQDNMPHAGWIVSGIRKVMRIIEESPTVDPVKHGHWILGDWHKSDGVYPNQGRKCSCCFRTCHITQVPWDAVYCPWCGAEMDGKCD